MDARSQYAQKYEFLFKGIYQKLNEEQQQAVDHIDGPVMVIAGPGTGKTQILAARIGKILIETDTAPHNILCLTYTDAATISMRQRLISMIGPEAHKIHIYTFHGFCNQVIQDNLGYFSNYRQLEPITDLERVDVYKKLLNDLPDDHRLKRLKTGVIQMDISRLRNLFSLMKKENFEVSDIEKAIDEYLEEMRTADDMFYKKSGKGYKKGDFKQVKFNDIERKMEELRAGALLFDTFIELMKEANRYDYDDMILWVLKAFKESDEILIEYQERYHYFLVDEFQDTNGAQKEILDQLTSFWSDAPNVFVVGDDDQAIYKFQGANLGNIKKFRKENDPKLVVLKKNYRSTQTILDASMKIIDNNQERIVKQPDFGLDKDLLSMKDFKAPDETVDICSFPNIVQEQAFLAEKLEKLKDENYDLSKIAILYRNHRQVEKLVEVLEKKGIPLNIKRRVDILKLPLIRNILNVLKYINAEYLNEGYTDKMLFELMHYNFFNINSSDIAKLIWKTRNLRAYDQEGQDKGSTPLGALLTDEKTLSELNLTTQKDILYLGTLLDKWIADISDVTLQVLFQNIINEGHVLNYILRHPDKSWLLQVLGTFFDLIKEESSKKPDLSLKEFLMMIDKMEENEIPLAINKIVSSDVGVHFLTAHSSKGLEFDEVIILGVTKDIWKPRTGGWGNFSYPPGLNGDNDANDEDERRLIYVAMTRAERKLTFTYGLAKETGKKLDTSQFIDEIVEATEIPITQQSVAEDRVVDFQYHVLKKEVKEVKLIDHDLIDRMLDGYKLSVTGLNKYLKCPVTFYFESVLRVPMARTKYLGFGRAVHYALEVFHRDLNESKEVSQSSLLQQFEFGMRQHRSHFTKEEYASMTTYGKIVLKKYYNKYLVDEAKLNLKYGLEVKLENAVYDGVPLKGVLDRVTIHKDFVEVTDYKTGKFANAKSKLSTPGGRYPEGGDYWRQIVFYKILLESDKKHNWNMTSGTMDFVEPDQKTDQFDQTKFVVSDEQINIVGEQIKETWKNIHDHKFEKGCGEDDCRWCNFVQNDYVMDSSLLESEEYPEPEPVQITLDL